MSSNSGVIVNRSNSVSPFYQALKSRNSKSMPELYSAEVNTEASAQSVVEVESSSSAGYSRTVRIELPRYGLLNRLYLHTRYSAAGGTVDTTNYAVHVPFLGAMAIREARLMYNGATLQKTDGFSIVSDLWKNSDDKERKHLQELLGAFDAANGTVANATASKYGDIIPMRSLVGSGAHDGITDFYCPLDFYFSAKHSPNRALDLSVLASPVTLEIDFEAQSNCWSEVGTTSTLPTISNVSAMCYLTELEMEVEKSYRALSYQAGGSPLTQIAFNQERVIVATNLTHTSNDTVVDIKLNQFTGNVFKLCVFAVLTDNFGSRKQRIKPGAIKEIQIKATGTNIVNQDNLSNKEAILESYHSGGEFLPLAQDLGTVVTGSNKITFANGGNKTAGGDVAAIDNIGGSSSGFTASSLAMANAIAGMAKGTDWDYNIDCNPQNFYEITFKKPYDMSKVSASGSCAFGALSVPSLRVTVAGSTNNGQFGSKPNVLGGACDIHCIAYSTSLMSYNTNSSGSTNIRMIAN